MQRVLDYTQIATAKTFTRNLKLEEVSDNRYSAKLVETPEEFEAVLRLRFDVFKRELSDNKGFDETVGIDFDEYDLHCEHLIVRNVKTGEAVGTYRLNTIEGAKNAKGFYAYNEFSIEDFPAEMLENSIELGRACIAKEHRNSRVLFMLWKGLAGYLTATKKRYLFGCCSIFTQNFEVAANVQHHLKLNGHVSEKVRVAPRKDRICIPTDFIPDDNADVDIPALVNIYLRIGAKICGAPAIDREFKTVDFFVIFDLETINRKYLKMFFGE